MITQDRLKELVNYDPNTGMFTWRVKTAARIKIGSSLGSRHHSGYLTAFLDKKRYTLHTLAVIYTDGECPVGTVDHINGIRDDNRRSNLRIATHSENTRNAKIRSDNRSGIKGVSYRNKSGGQWVCRIYTDEGRKYLGCYKTREEAERVMQEARAKYHGAFAREK